MQHLPRKPFSRTNIIFYIFAIIIFVLAVHFASKIKNVEETFSHIQPIWIWLAVIAQILTYVFNALIFYVLLGRRAGSIKITELIKIAIVSFFFNQLLPSGGLSGTGFVFDEFGHRGIPTKQSFSAIIIQAFSSYIAIIGLLYVSGGIYLLLGHSLPHLFLYVAIAGTVLYAVLGALMLFLGKPSVVASFERKLSRSKFIERYLKKMNFLSVSEEGTNPVRVFWKNKGSALIIIALQMGIFIADAVTILAFVHGLGLSLNFISIIFGLMLTLIVAAIPTLPGALIIYEGSMTLFYTTLGLPIAGALALTLLYRALSFWFPIPIGLVLYRRMTRRS